MVPATAGKMPLVETLAIETFVNAEELAAILMPKEPTNEEVKPTSVI